MSVTLSTFIPVTLFCLSVHTLTSPPTKVTTIITTHYVDEARGANKVGFLRAGRLLAEDSPQVRDIDAGADMMMVVVIGIMMMIRTYLVAGAVRFLPGTYSGTSICNPLPGIITHSSTPH